MQESTVKLKKKRGFFEAFSNNKADEIAARKLMRDLVNKQSGYQIQLQTKDSILAIDQDRNVKIYDRSWDVFKGQYIKEWTLQNNEITKITLSTYPSNLATAIGKFVFAGGLMYGVAGLAVGAVVDALKGPKREDIYIWFEFHIADYPYATYACKYEALMRPQVPLTNNSIVGILQEVRPFIGKLNELFPNKFEDSSEKEEFSKEDLAFLKSLLPEEGPEMCNQKDCNHKKVNLSAKCAKHHFEMVRNRLCPWNVSEDGTEIKE